MSWCGSVALGDACCATRGLMFSRPRPYRSAGIGFMNTFAAAAPNCLAQRSK